MMRGKKEEDRQKEKVMRERGEESEGEKRGFRESRRGKRINTRDEKF